MSIPKKFKVGRRAYDVYLTRHIAPRITGRIYYDLKKVLIATHDVHRMPRTPRAQTGSFWHETTHAILHDMGHALHTDEQFVTAFSTRLNQIVHSAKGVRR